MNSSLRKLIPLVVATTAVAGSPVVSGDRLRAHVRFLASNALEGRGIGTRGEELAVSYISSQFALAGARPAGDNGTFLQKVPLTGVRTKSATRITAVRGAETLALLWLDDFAGNNRRQTPRERLEADVVFAGYGIVAPEFGWDDYKGVNVRGKAVVLFANEPPSEDPKFFAGKALTPYGRWPNKFEEARRQGAVAALLIHTTQTAGYDWQVVRTSWNAEEPYFPLAPGTRELAFAGWATEETGARLVKPATPQDLLAKSASRSFRPYRLGWRMRFDIVSEVRRVDTHNVVAILPGSETESEAVVYSAHWDSLGIGGAVDGDSIYNGAADNATGCAVLLEIARAWGALPHKPRRSAIFVATTAEEGNLQGSAYYASHPSTPAGKTVLNVNLDVLPPTARASDVIVMGVERTTLEPLVQQVARRFRLTVSPDPYPEHGTYHRSDNFSFARAGIPALLIRNGTRPAAGTTEDIGELNTSSISKHYHQPSDEYREDWDFSGIEQAALFAFALGLDAANMKEMPSWKDGEEFLPARVKSRREAGYEPHNPNRPER